MNAVEAKRMRVRYGSKKALRGVDLEVAEGSVHGLLGPNGAGKTTAVRALATLVRLSSGSARLFGHDVMRDPAKVREHIGLTGQYASVDNTLSAAENLTLLGRLLGLSRRGAKERTAELLAEFSLDAVGGNQVSSFSGGMRRRLDLAACLVGRPPLIFLDEPTTGLDPRTRLDMWATVRGLVAAGTTVLLTTQYLEEADQLCDRISIIDAGTVVAEGTAAELKKRIAPATLRLELARTSDVVPALAATADLVELRTDDDPDVRVLTAVLLDPELATDVLIALRAHGIRLSGMSVSEPSLDDVFLSLTGDGQGTPARERSHA